VEDMPRFPGCEDAGSKEEIKKCAEDKLIQYVYKNLKYPAIAKENGIDGKVYIQFVVSETGDVKNAKIVRDIGAGCGEAALKVVESMNNMPQKWIPGKQRGRPVQVLFTLPIQFRLE
jgi:protein TonB